MQALLLLPSHKKSIGNKFGAKLMQISTVWSMDLLIRKILNNLIVAFQYMLKISLFLSFEDNHLLLF